jgi:hypothetical protein
MPGPFLLDRGDSNFDVKLDILESEDLVETEGVIEADYS